MLARVIGPVLFEHYARLLDSGRPVTSHRNQSDVTRMFSEIFAAWQVSNFQIFVGSNETTPTVERDR
jgi:hypothetical protein